MTCGVFYKAMFTLERHEQFNDLNSKYRKRAVSLCFVFVLFVLVKETKGNIIIDIKKYLPYSDFTVTQLNQV